MKLKLLFTIFIFSYFLLFTIGKTYAQEYKSISSFDMSKPVSTTHIAKDNIEKSNVFIKVDNITTVAIRQGSFKENVDALIYQGNWDILTKGTNGPYSPISAYYIAFVNSQGNEITPLGSVQIEIYDNYIGATATLTPISRGKGLPDTTNIRTFPNQAVVRDMLPSNDSGFIVSVNKTINKNDSSLHPTIINSNPSVVLSPSINPKPTASANNSFLKQNFYLILALAVITISIVGIAFLLLKGTKKTNI